MIQSFFNDVMFALTMLMMIPVGLFYLIIMFVAFNAEAKRKQREQEAKDREKAAESVAASVVVSKDDGRVIAQLAPEPQSVMPAVAPPLKGGDSIASNAAKQFAGRAAAGIAWHLLKIWLRPKH